METHSRIRHEDPTGRAFSPTLCMRVQIYTKCSKTYSPLPGRQIFLRELERDLSMFRQYIPIQLVRVRLLDVAPVGSGALRSNTADVVETRKPP